jgi:tetratricopeptide (TPR) repeat protein
MMAEVLDTIEWPDSGFPGIRTSPETLLPSIVDQEACEAALQASTDPADRIFVLLVEGHAAEAAELLAEARYSDPESFRLRIFEAEVLRVSNRLDRSIELYRQLLAEVAGTPREALVHQYLGNTYFAAGNVSAAVECFSKALDLRVAGSADAVQIYSSTMSLQRARDVLELSA